MYTVMRGLDNYRGIIEKDKLYSVKETGFDWHRLKNNIYVWKFLLGPVLEDFEDDDYEYYKKD